MPSPKSLHRILISILTTLAIILLSSCSVDSVVDAYVWADTNCNGLPDPEEPPLSGVCVWWAYGVDYIPGSQYCTQSINQTDSDGGFYRFVAGSSCNDFYVVIQVPTGFEPTTDTIASGCQSSFGLAPESTCPKRTVRTQADLIAEQKQQRQSQAITCGIFETCRMALGQNSRPHNWRFWKGSAF